MGPLKCLKLAQGWKNGPFAELGAIRRPPEIVSGSRSIGNSVERRRKFRYGPEVEGNGGKSNIFLWHLIWSFNACRFTTQLESDPSRFTVATPGWLSAMPTLWLHQDIHSFPWKDFFPCKAEGTHSIYIHLQNNKIHQWIKEINPKTWMNLQYYYFWKNYVTVQNPDTSLGLSLFYARETFLWKRFSSQWGYWSPFKVLSWNGWAFLFTTGAFLYCSRGIREGPARTPISLPWLGSIAWDAWEKSKCV